MPWSDDDEGLCNDDFASSEDGDPFERLDKQVILREVEHFRQR